VEYLESHDIRFRIDQTNLEEKYLRNKVRKRLLPMMRELFGDAVERNIHRAGAIFAEHESLLRQIAGEETDKVTSRTPFGKLVLDLTLFRQYHPLIRRALVALSFEQLTGSLTNFEHAAVERVFSAANKGSGKADLKGGLIAEVIGERLYIYRGKQECLPMELEVPGTTHLEDFGLVVTVELAPSAETSTATLRGGRNLRIYLDADELPRELWIRNWSPGDRFTPLGMVGSKSLADFLTDRGVDRPLREEIPILYGRGKQGDQIFWVVGYEIADYAKITERTKRITKLEVLPYRGV
jgi:tRNA(Ile)-lysidine synthase